MSSWDSFFVIPDAVGLDWDSPPCEVAILRTSLSRRMITKLFGNERVGSLLVLHSIMLVAFIPHFEYDLCSNFLNKYGNQTQL